MIVSHVVSKLKQGHIPANGIYVFCGKEKYIEHSFLFCQFTREVKLEYGFYLYHKTLNCAKQWLFNFLGRSSTQEATVFAVTMWHIWEARNGVRNDKGLLHPQNGGYEC